MRRRHGVARGRGSSARLAVGVLLATAALLSVSAATAKDFGPGDLRVCSARHCVPIVDRAVLRTFSSFYYGGRPRPRIVRAPRAGAPALQLEFRNGFAAEIVGGPGLDRTLVYGLNCGRFRRGTWYRLPPRAADEVRRLGRRLKPLRVNPASVPRSC
jgi:hypothetical protein